MKSQDFVLDCSVTMAWCFEDEATEYTEQVFDSLMHTMAFVPSLWGLEVANVLLIAERKKRLTRIQSAAFKDSLRMLPIRMNHTMGHRAMDSIMALANETQLTIYDAAYLELALNAALPLATLDKELRKAATMMGVKLYHSSKKPNHIGSAKVIQDVDDLLDYS